MLTKILFTIFVIIVVALVFRVKTMRERPQAAKPADSAARGISAKVIAYTLVGLVVALSGLIYLLHWQDQHTIVNIQVVDGGSGKTATYQAYKKSIEGREFVTLDGRKVTLGNSDRVEMSNAQ
jgi:multisubunit Na+/H+ antiporter MnhB subunit